MQRRSGLTLIELMVGLTVTALLVTVLMTAYTQGTRGYHQIESQQLVDQAVETALMEMETATKHAMFAELINNRLMITLPRDFDENGKPIPHRVKKRLVYRAGELYAYYLSDSTGSPQRTGIILWRGRVNPGGSITPETQLASPITRFNPTVTTESSGMYVVIDMEVQVAMRAQTFKAVRQRVYLLPNANTWR